ncbi:hypothetical protein [Photobacterium leiognathi]|uniref:hypothetical protein n=1 Tax=Photobacterium leiognathi TaxID=553611 RepID=UPI00298120C2|nr:hypothetical protein [Photobacterium leiognathi]
MNYIIFYGNDKQLTHKSSEFELYSDAHKFFSSIDKSIFNTGVFFKLLRDDDDKLITKVPLSHNVFCPDDPIAFYDELIEKVRTAVNEYENK